MIARQYRVELTLKGGLRCLLNPFRQVCVRLVEFHFSDNSRARMHMALFFPENKKVDLLDGETIGK